MSNDTWPDPVAGTSTVIAGIERIRHVNALDVAAVGAPIDHAVVGDLTVFSSLGKR